MSDYDNPQANGVLSGQVLWRWITKLSQDVAGFRIGTPASTARKSGGMGELDSQRSVWWRSFNGVVLTGNQPCVLRLCAMHHSVIGQHQQ